MSSVNKVMILGNAGGDPIVNESKNGDKVVKLNVATSIHWKDKMTNEKKEQTEWHKVVFFKGLADIVCKYVTKGTKVFIEGSIKSRKWKNDDGEEKVSYDIVASSLQLISAGKKLDEAASSDSAYRKDDYKNKKITVEPIYDDLDDIPF